MSRLQTVAQRIPAVFAVIFLLGSKDICLNLRQVEEFPECAFSYSLELFKYSILRCGI
jgi:hypothetical protein